MVYFLFVEGLCERQHLLRNKFRIKWNRWKKNWLNWSERKLILTSLCFGCNFSGILEIIFGFVYRQCRLLEFNLHCMQTDPQFTYYSYVTWDDLIQCFGNDLVLTVRNYDLYKSSFVKVSSWCIWCRCFHISEFISKLTLRTKYFLFIPGTVSRKFTNSIRLSVDWSEISFKRTKATNVRSIE